jgi:D-alanyl-lipoteichoic acid acyltransferase DltB (MBOAT superfamily)
VNYNQVVFWLLFLVVYLAYWRLNHRRQNLLLLVASYVFYGFWDYRFLFLILVSTVIDFIGGLGVAGVELPRRRRWQLGALLVGAALLLCSNIRYAAGFHGLPHRARDLAIPFAVAAATLVYGAALPRLYAAQRRREIFLALSMVANLGILGFFKYCDFFISSFGGLLALFGFRASPSVLGIILPAGISFYTFQAMSYTIDIYRGEVKPTERFADFALFVCFFPHLVAGPIMRAHTLLPQVVRPRHQRAGDAREGLLLVMLGLFKKLVLSDNMAPIANAVFFRLADGRTADLTGAEVMVGLYAFAFQIYGDFSGYSSIARGISKWLGFDLVINFHLPYLAVSPSDFWRRWHISLSTWLRDYLYIPLGGNRRGEYRNLLLTMLLGGLWHGASWTFVAWGLYHGLILCLFRRLGIRDVRPADGRLRWAARVVGMFHVTCLGWLLFRADSFAAVGRALALMLGHFAFTPFAATGLALIAAYGGVLFAIELVLDGESRLQPLLEAPWALRGAVCAYLVLGIAILQSERAYEFIYFQF